MAQTLHYFEVTCPNCGDKNAIYPMELLGRNKRQPFIADENGEQMQFLDKSPCASCNRRFTVAITVTVETL
jgi:hypothetical protein